MSPTFYAAVAKLEEVDLTEGELALYEEVLGTGAAVQAAVGKRLDIKKNGQDILVLYDEAGNEIYRQDYIKVGDEMVPVRTD